MEPRADEPELERIARELGLERALAVDRDAFASALAAARGLAARAPRPDLHDEPAHVYRPDGPADAGDG